MTTDPAAKPAEPAVPGAAVEPQEPSHRLSDPRELLAAYLDFYRAAVLRKLDGLDEGGLRTARLPSGWTPLELLKHLAHVERRWLVWGFANEEVDEPWADNDPQTGRWRVRDDESAADVRAFFLAQAEHSRRIVAEAPGLDAPSALGGRFATAADAPSLAWILFHLLQEYARHTGHLDVVRELSDGAVGE